MTCFMEKMHKGVFIVRGMIKVCFNWYGILFNVIIYILFHCYYLSLLCIKCFKIFIYISLVVKYRHISFTDKLNCHLNESDFSSTLSCVCALS